MSTLRQGSIFEVWSKYEEIAMHFNELIMKLRIQALAGVAAISTVAGILGHHEAGGATRWGLLSAVFAFLCLFWIAIWVLDFKYYTRLLLGAVDALLVIEKLSKHGTDVAEINMSTLIEEAVEGSKYRHASKADRTKRRRLAAGRLTFYLLVFSGLLVALAYSAVRWWC
jgi:hypothetical protein